MSFLSKLFSRQNETQISCSNQELASYINGNQQKVNDYMKRLDVERKEAFDYLKSMNKKTEDWHNAQKSSQKSKQKNYRMSGEDG